MNDVHVTAEEAAAEVRVKTATVYSWVHRGYLTPAYQRGRYRLFRLSDVFRAERECRKRDTRGALV